MDRTGCGESGEFRAADSIDALRRFERIVRAAASVLKLAIRFSCMGARFFLSSVRITPQQAGRLPVSGWALETPPLLPSVVLKRRL